MRSRMQNTMTPAISMLLDVPERVRNQSTRAASSSAIAGGATRIPPSAGGAGASRRVCNPALAQISSPAAMSHSLTPRS
jgi:hypothetical protein